jgi:Tfp pilus assembly protein FimT
MLLAIPQHRIHPALLLLAEMLGSQSYDTLVCIKINCHMETVWSSETRLCNRPDHHIYSPHRETAGHRVATRIKAQVFGRSSSEIVGSNPSGGIDVCLL